MERMKIRHFLRVFKIGIIRLLAPDVNCSISADVDAIAGKKIKSQIGKIKKLERKKKKEACREKMSENWGKWWDSIYRGEYFNESKDDKVLLI